VNGLEKQLSEAGVLEKAWKSVSAAGGGPGLDGVTLAQFQAQSTARLQQMRATVARGRYRFSRLKTAIIPKSNGKERTLGIPIVADRVVLQAIRQTIEPLCEPLFLNCSHAYRPNRGAQTALSQMTAAMAEGYQWVLEADIENFFDSIQHAALSKQLHTVQSGLGDERLIRQSMGLSRGWWPMKKGVCQGSPLSPLLANVALQSFDQALVASGQRLIRYADDFVVLCRDEAAAQEAQRQAACALGAVGLRLHPNKTRIIDNGRCSFRFLGFEIQPDRIAPAAENIAQLKSGILAWCNPQAMWPWEERVQQVNALLRSFAWYYHQIDTRRLYLTLDAFAIEQLAGLAASLGRDSSTVPSELIRISEMREVSWASQRKRRPPSWGGYR
jgi:group II intron reverse transcriptase/maturase